MQAILTLFLFLLNVLKYCEGVLNGRFSVLNDFLKLLSVS